LPCKSEVGRLLHLAEWKSCDNLTTKGTKGNTKGHEGNSVISLL
jgi:hypothetical protein